MGLDPTTLLLGGDSLKQKSFYKLCDYLESVGKEEKVSHVVLDLSGAGIDMNRRSWTKSPAGSTS